MKRKNFVRSLCALFALICSIGYAPSANAQTYCVPAFINGCDGFNPWHNNTISVNTLSWSIGTTDCSIYNYTAMSTTLTAGTGYLMTVTSGVYTGCSVWIDLNDDGNFDEPGENMFHEYLAPATGYATYTFTLTIPTCTPSGSYRMRVLAGWGTDGYTSGTYGGNGYGSCGSVDTPYQYGNFDDFTINVIGTTICDTPTALVATTVTSTTATFSWTAPTCSAGFEYILNTTPGTPTGAGTLISGTTYTATGLTPGTTYYFHLLSKCSATDSSAWIVLPTTTLTNCAGPVTPSVSDITPTTATFSWSAPSGTSVSDYQYTLNTTGIPPTAPGTATSATSWSATGLTPGDTYYFYVRTICTSGDSSAWEVVSFTTPMPCDPPSGMSVSGLTSTKAIISWVSPSGAAVSHYQYVLGPSPSVPTGAGTDTTSTVLDTAGLLPATSYYFYIRTMCADGDSSGWAAFSFTTNPPCEIPLAIAADSITDNSAQLTWASPGGAPASGYLYALDNTPAPSGYISYTSADAYSAIGLTSDTTYYFHIRTICADGDTSAWTTISFTTEPMCGTPVILTHDDTYQGIHIVWSSVYEALQYQYVLDNDPATPAVAGTPTEDTIYNMIGLDPRTTYYFHLSVICEGGNAPWQTISFTTTPPTSVSNVNASDGLSINVSPNPAKDYVTISIDGTPAGNALIQLMDMTGRTIQTAPVTGKTMTLDLSAIPQGIYLVHYTDDINKETIKLVK